MNCGHYKFREQGYVAHLIPAKATIILNHEDLKATNNIGPRASTNVSWVLEDLTKGLSKGLITKKGQCQNIIPRSSNLKGITIKSRTLS